MAKNTLKLKATIWKNDIVWDNKSKLLKYFKTIDDGKEIEVEFREPKKIRTSGQPGEETNFNGYYWGIIVKMVADEMGELDQDYVHNLLQLSVGNIRNSGKERYPDRPQYCPSQIWELLKENGFIKCNIADNVPGGTKGMTGGEFAEYCSKCRIWASKELNLYIPEPYEVGWE